MQNWILLSANIPPPWHFGSALRAIRSALPVSKDRFSLRSQGRAKEAESKVSFPWRTTTVNWLNFESATVLRLSLWARLKPHGCHTLVTLVFSSFQDMVVPKEISVHSVTSTTHFKVRSKSISAHVPTNWDVRRSNTRSCYRWSLPRIWRRCSRNCKEKLAAIPMSGLSLRAT